MSSFVQCVPLRSASPATLYRLFGLTLRSEVPLPCPRADAERQNADVDLVESEQLPVPSSAPASVDDDGFWRCCTYPDGSTHSLWREHFEFLVSAEADRIWWRRLQDVADDVFFTYLLGQVLSYSLLAKGIDPLHATAVVVDGEAIGLLGNCGFGKSTLAAAFLRAGYRLLTDDVLALQLTPDGVVAHPSHPRIKLTPAAAEAFFDDRPAVPMNSFTNKMIYSVNEDQHAASPVKLRALYALPEGGTVDGSISVEKLHGRDAFLRIIKSPFNVLVVTPDRLKQQFAFAETLAGLVPIKQLSYPRDFSQVPRVVETIVADLRQERRP